MMFRIIGLFSYAFSCAENKSFYEVEQWRALSNDTGLFSVTLTGKIPCELQASCIALLVVCTRAGCEELKIDGDAPEAYAVSVVKTVSNSYIELKSDPRVSHLWKILKGCVENSTSSARLWIIIGPKIATFSQEFEALNHVEKLSKVSMKGTRKSTLELTFLACTERHIESRPIYCPRQCEF